MVRQIATQKAGRLHGTLGASSIVFMVVAAAAPLTVIAGVMPIGFAVGNGAGLPAIFAAVGVMLVVFSVGFTVMARHVPRPGAFFTYIAHGLGRPAGLGAAFAAILCYLAFELGVMAYFGYELSAAIDRYASVHVHWMVFTGVAICAVGWLGFRRVELSAHVLAVLLTLEVAIVVLISVVAVVTGGAEGLNLASFSPEQIASGAPSLALMFAAASFVGFEATAIFRDEARDPQHTVPRATFAAVILIGVFYTFAAWAFVMAWGTGNVAERAATDPAFLFSTANAHLGQLGEFVTHLLVITSIFAAALAFHSITTRYLHALAKAEVLPPFLARTSPRDGAPSSASLTTTVATSALVMICLVAGMDPVSQIFTWFVGLGAFVYLLLLAVCALAVLTYFARNGRAGEPIWSVVISPLLALLGLGYSAWITAKNFPLLVGDVDTDGNPVFGALSMALLASVAVTVGTGVVLALVLRARGARAYGEITEARIAV
ncbi:APC family permease [Mycolicibacterium goodii]|uniref:APC family permease n=1 Tax=Mycolicibacterium goodii TaxID=134601 RepID=UPI001BDC237E|nr:APC family permease [Mycolicibacterium goodii]MBU8816510.1 APC family permease [Mycolicibacterium goodii]MBU8831624.1 APC family permease [Mycolicibacterium goodii]